ncbi:MAG: ATP-dependent helicase UvrD/PcrA, partial [Acidobacteriota bacterium]|nr:ATP-dependent helicase UvrD/PcrA [Acidobacteriota bacterium]
DILRDETTAVITKNNWLAKQLQKNLSKKSDGKVSWYTKCKLISGKKDADEELRTMILELRKCKNDENLRKWFGELLDGLLINPIEISGEKIEFAKHFLVKEEMLEGRKLPLLCAMRDDFCFMFESISINNFEGISKLYDFILKYSFELVKGKSFLNPDWLYYIRQFSKVTRTISSLATWDEYCDKLESTLLMAGHCRRNMHDGLTILNVHQSKGRQFDHVILAWMSQKGEEPYNKDKPCFDFNSEEERRLLYVAMTRAKRRVTIIYPEESPADILKKWKLI